MLSKNSLWHIYLNVSLKSKYQKYQKSKTTNKTQFKWNSAYSVRCRSLLIVPWQAWGKTMFGARHTVTSVGVCRSAGRGGTGIPLQILCRHTPCRSESKASSRQRGRPGNSHLKRSGILVVSPKGYKSKTLFRSHIATILSWKNNDRKRPYFPV